MTHDDIQRLREIVEDLEDIRGRFGRVEGTDDLDMDIQGDDYRQAKIDVALDCLQEVESMIQSYDGVGMWPDE